MTQVVLNNLTFVAMDMCGLFQSCSSFQNAHQASDFRLLRSLEPDATMEPRYLKSDTWLIESGLSNAPSTQQNIMYHPRMYGVLINLFCCNNGT